MASETLHADRPTAATRIVEAFEEWCLRMANNRERYAVISHISGFAVDAVARTVLRDHNLSTFRRNKSKLKRSRPGRAMRGWAWFGSARQGFFLNGVSMKTATIKASELIEDFDLYPRGDVDSSHVSQIAEALAAGETMPPVIACKATKRIVDGFHRRRAAIKFGGSDATVEVIFKTYANDGELFLDAMEHNSGHGRRLTSVDAVRSATKAKSFGLDDIVIAKALKMTVERVGALVVDRTAKCGPNVVSLKQTIRHMAGKKLTKTQEAANQKLSGMNQVFYVNQIITLVENDLLDKENEELLKRLQVLQGLLETLLVTSS